MIISQKAIKNPHNERKLFAHRLIFIYCCVTLLASLLIGRLLFLQVYEFKKYTTLSNKNQLNIIPIEPTRGVIYDRNGILLAENIPIYSLELTPDKVRQLDKTIASLKKLLPSIQSEDVESFYKLKSQHHPFDSIPLKLSLTPEEVAIFSVNQYRFSGVSVKAHLIRHYPEGKTMAHVLGYVARINPDEWTKVDRVNYSATNFIGKIGIEKYYEDILHGTVGYEQVETNANGRVVRTLNRTPPISGHELHLSIDLRLQKAAENALGENRGAVIAIDPNNGEILAMVSTPSYDPNLFVQGIAQKTFNKLMRDPKQPLYNRAIRGQYPMASTIKPYMALAALDGNIVSPTYKIFDPGWFSLPNSSHRYRDWRKGGHGWVNVVDAITVSCDVYFYTVGYMMGIKRIDSFLSRVGYGQRTGIDMNEELPGLLPTPEWKRGAKGVSWYPGDTVSSSIGQGYMLTTPIQLANAVASISQRGIRYKPHLLLTYKIPGKKTIQPTPVKLPPVVLHDNHTWDFVFQGMQQVVTSPRGTGYAFRNAPYTVAAKTGTAQVYTIKQNESNEHNQNLPEALRNHSLFIAFAPVDHPAIAIGVIVENCHDAAIIARQVMDTYLLKLNPIPYNKAP